MSSRGVTGVKGVRPSPAPTVANPCCAVRLRCAAAVRGCCVATTCDCCVAAACGCGVWLRRVSAACGCGV